MMHAAVRSGLASLREAPATKAERFARSYQTAVRSVDRLTSRTTRRLDALLRELRGEVLPAVADLAPDPTAPFRIRAMPEIAASIDDALRTYTAGASAEIRSAMEETWGLGETVSARAVRAAGVPLAFPAVSAEQLAVLTATFDDVLTEVSSRIASQIMREVRLSAAGLDPSSATVRRIADILRPLQEVKGIRKRLAVSYQAERIARTEIARTYSAAQQAATTQMAENIPELRKRWASIKRVRRGHLDAEARYAPGGSVGPIRVDEAFRVTEFSRDRPVTDRMLYPRDPSASAGNVVNCGCITLEVLPEPEFEAAAERARGVLTP